MHKIAFRFIRFSKGSKRGKEREREESRKRKKNSESIQTQCAKLKWYAPNINPYIRIYDFYAEGDIVAFLVYERNMQRGKGRKRNEINPYKGEGEISEMRHTRKKKRRNSLN